MCCMSDGQAVLHYKKHVFHVCECLITLTVILFLYISKTVQRSACDCRILFLSQTLNIYLADGETDTCGSLPAAAAHRCSASDCF